MSAPDPALTALAEIRSAMDECFDPDIGGVDWRDDAAIQRMAFKVYRVLYRAAPPGGAT